jgi:CHAT domain-containing protein
MSPALMMVMFHHYLSNGHPHPADALRAAQLWMLDRARPVLDGLPANMNDGAGSSFLARPYSWAAFTYQGC